jgi:hypothetical protein
MRSPSFKHRVARARPDRAAADDDHRLLALRDEVGGFFSAASSIAPARSA